MSEHCRVLVVEDDKERIDLFRDWLPTHIRPVFATSPGTALSIISRDNPKIYVGLMLDHDLGEQIKIEAELSFCGTNVASAICCRMRKATPVLIHSMNTFKAKHMQRMLASNGFTVTRTPFANLTRKNLERWIEQVRDEHEFRHRHVSATR